MGVSNTRIREIGKEFEITVKDVPIFRAILLNYLGKEYKEVSKELIKVKKELSSIEKHLDEDIPCSLCNGIGHQTKIRIVRNGDLIREVLETREYPLCKRAGTIRTF